ncbi:MAG: nitrilase-related carbon-nitrogen hydrolase [Acidimicrobiales bacterium]
MKVAGIQCDLVWENREANLKRLRPLIEDATTEGARIVLLPEMFPSGFSMQTDEIAEDPDGTSAEFLHEVARTTGSFVGGSFSCRVPGLPKPTNRFLIAGPAGEEVVYDKIHPFSYGGETEHYAAGDRVVSFEIDGAHFTPFVCYDLRFSDLFWNVAEATDCYTVVANWPSQRQSHWDDLLRARAIENQAYVIGVNRVGTGGGLDYVGGSVVYGPFGETVAQVGSEETTVSAEIDPAHVKEIRRRFPFIADR